MSASRTWWRVHGPLQAGPEARGGAVRCVHTPPCGCGVWHAAHNPMLLLRQPPSRQTPSTTGAMNEVPREAGPPPDVLPAALATFECIEQPGGPGAWTGDGGYQVDDFRRSKRLLISKTSMMVRGCVLLLCGVAMLLCDVREIRRLWSWRRHANV